MNQPQDRLWNREFTIATAILLLAAASLAAFFDFQKYLQALPVPKEWLGPLIGADGLAGLVVQILVTPLLNEGNARRAMALGTITLGAALLSYRWALAPLPILLVRLLHGSGFVILLAALMVVVVKVIPAGRSGMAFGVISMARLLPYAMVPPLLGLFPPGPGQFGVVISTTALVAAPILAMIAFIRKPAAADPTRQPAPRPPLKALGRNLVARPVATLLLVNLLLNCGYVIVFFFIALYAKLRGVHNPGLFFTIVTVLMLASRLVGSPILDRGDKRKLAIGAHLILLPVYPLLIVGQGEPAFFAIATLAGLGWGLALPLLNALLFDHSAPSFRAVNLNSSMIAIQASFFLGPLLGGLVVTTLGYPALFWLCALTTLGSILLLLSLKHPGVNP